MTRTWYRRLNVQLVALLTLALLPLGAVAVFQTNQVSVEADRRAGVALLGMTERAARIEQELIERAIGAARLLGQLAPALTQSPEECAPFLSAFVDANPEYNSIGVYPVSGYVNCSSLAEPFFMSEDPDLAAMMADQESSIIINEPSSADEESEFIISEPYYIDGTFAGFISVAVPHRQLPRMAENLAELGLVELVTYDDNGVMLTSRNVFDEAELELPRDRTLAQLPVNQSLTFVAENRAGDLRRYSIVTIKGVPAAIMAVWKTDSGMPGSDNSVAPVLFPILMWVASMGVAMLAMQTLVLRHLQRMQNNMDAFAQHRRMVKPMGNDPLLPIEIADLEAKFNEMSQDIIQDEADLEDALREKSVLVKEIHHRVKNNLQLISSIMNMQIRTAQHDETRRTLLQVQDRVISLATIHRDLYQSEDGGRVNAGSLVREIVENSVRLAKQENRAPNLNIEIDDLMLYPDQAVPLSLLTAEAASNAATYLAGPDVDKGDLDVSLKGDSETRVLTVSNTVADGFVVPDGSGLGNKLMRAFAQQLGGVMTTDYDGTKYHVSVQFSPRDFALEARDY